MKLNNKLTFLGVTLLLVAAFFLGSLWTKVKILEEKTKPNPQNVANQPSPSPQVAGAKVEVPIRTDDPVKGNSGAKVTIVEFSDFECPFCGRAQQTLKQIEEAYKDQVRFVFKQFPLPFHTNAPNAALASLCAQDQGKFWEYHDKLFANQTALSPQDLKKYAQELGLNAGEFSACLENKKYQAQVDQDMKDGQTAGVGGTPAFFINGRLVSGAQPFENFKTIIEEELKE